MKFIQFFALQLICIESLFTIYTKAEFKITQFHQAESLLLDTLENYIKNYEKKISNLKRNLEEYQKEHEQAEHDVVKYLSNPINAYLLTKRLTVDWQHIKNMMKYDTGYEIHLNITKESLRGNFPNEQNLKDLIKSLLELQENYHLTVDEIASGLVEETKFSGPLSAADCFEIGIYLLHNESYNASQLWLEQSLKHYETEKANNKETFVNKTNILSNLSWINYRLENFEVSLEQAKKALDMNPMLEYLLNNIKMIEKRLSDVNNKTLPDEIDEKWLTKNDDVTEIGDKSYNFIELFRKQCHGEIIKPAKFQKYLFCSYFSNGNAFLQLAPIKFEEVNYEPYIVVIHNILADSEIDILKELSKNNLITAENPKEFSSVPIENSQNEMKLTYLNNSQNGLFPTLDRRIEDVTGLNMNSAEILQVIKYESGGYYEPHFDFLTKNQYSTEMIDYNHKGNRIATILFYLSDVEKGGETVFPFLDTVITPTKGSAVFWFNLHANGKNDLRTLHGSCPVLSGAKWEANKWIRELNQEFRRPCELHPDDDYE